MKLATRHNTVLSGGNIGEDSKFSIDVNAKMFRVLSDTMYQDKIGSMVRELSCNAMDAHAMAGKNDVPFSIHVPDSIEPWFSVKDEGIGLSDSDLRTMYTTYGRSTKDNSNDVVGAFGLGSKTPFAYTDQFTVTSIFDGVKRTYVAVINDDGLPVLKMHDETTTDEHPGLEITVSVNDSDYRSFREAIIRQLKFFNVKPTLLNNRHGIQFPDLNHKVMIERDDIRVYEGVYANSPLRDTWIVQGGVGYPLNLEQLSNISANVKKFAKTIESKGAIITFDIGQIEVTASRESLSYTENVCKRIIKRLTDVATILCKEAMDKIQKMDSVWERAAFYNEQLDVIQDAICQSVDFDKLFPGTAKDRSGRLIMDVEGLIKKGFTAIQMVKYEASSKSYPYKQKDPRLMRKRVTVEHSMYTDTVCLYPNENYNVFVRDTNSKPIARLKLFSEQNNWPSILLIESIKMDITDDDIKIIAKEMSMPVSKIKKLSALEAPKRVGASSSNIRPRAYQLQNNNEIFSSKNWLPIFDDLDDLEDTVWVRMDRHDILLNDDSRLVLNAFKNGLFDKDVIAVNNQTADRIENGKIGDNLIKVADAANELRKTLDGMIPIYRAFHKYDAFIDAVRGDIVLRTLIQNDIIRDMSCVIKRRDQLRKRLNGWETIISDEEKTRKSGYSAGENRVKAVMDKYPMLRYVSAGSIMQNDCKRDIENYIEMIDKKS